LAYTTFGKLWEVLYVGLTVGSELSLLRLNVSLVHYRSFRNSSDNIKL